MLFRFELCGSAYYVMPTYEVGPTEIITEHGCRMLYNAREIEDFIGSWSSKHAKLVARRTGGKITFSIEEE